VFWSLEHTGIATQAQAFCKEGKQVGFRYDACVVGTGRVGLPLALTLIDVGMQTVGLEIDPQVRAAVNSGQMPFHEPGFEELVASRRLELVEDEAGVGESGAIIITVGTPLLPNIETDLSQVKRVFTSIRPFLRPGHLLCLRSTVAPGTTRYLQRLIERETDLVVGETVALAFCPERIAEGKAREEIRSLPQIVGTEDDYSRELASCLWSQVASEVLHTDYVSAELVKLFNNSARYVEFALANQFALICESFGSNIFEVRNLANHNYPRTLFAAPGLTAGTCLRKDFGMINEWQPYPDLLLSAWKINEYMPAFLVERMRDRIALHDRRVGILGFSFKKDTDDLRDSLAPKLARYIERETPSEIRVSDPNFGDIIADPVNGDIENWSTAEALADADAVFVATNHTGYPEALRAAADTNPDCWVADLWGITDAGKIFFQLRELA
jgi:UDP-N-acetyl-D-mannosaminuronic acid dehydrogenase